MKKTLLFSALALTASVFGDGNVSAFTDEIAANDSCNPKPKPKPVCEPCVRKAMQPIVLTSSRPCNDSGFYFFADFLYWHADVGSSDWAFVNNNTTASVAAGPNKDVNFKWNFGFRVGFGIDMDHDQWDTDIYYTWFRGTTSSDSSDNAVSVVAPALANSLDSNYAGTFTAGSAKDKLNFNVLDWELGRWFYVSNSISLRPHMGLKGAWIDLKETESLTGGLVGGVGAPTAYSVNNKTKSWAIGPSAGVNSNWYFGSGNTADMRSGHSGEVKSRPMFSFFADFAGALMFSHFKNTHSETATTASALPGAGGFSPSNLTRNQVVPVLTSIAGFAFDTCFDCDKMHFGIRVGYEFQWWFRENQRLFVDTTSATSPRYVRTADDLALQGLTVDFRFDF
jgi:hypothetical protein